MEALLFLLGIGLVAAGGISSSNRNARLKQINEEYAKHNYIDHFRQRDMEEEASYIYCFGGFDTDRIKLKIMEKFNVDYFKAADIMAVGLAKYFVEKFGYEYDFEKNRFKVSAYYDISCFLTEEYRMDDYEKIMNMSDEELRKFDFLMRKSDAYRKPGRIMMRWKIGVDAVNDRRRKLVKNTIKKLKEALNIIENIKFEEEFSMNNLPESLKDSVAYDQFEGNIEILDNAESDVSTVISELELL